MERDGSWIKLSYIGGISSSTYNTAHDHILKKLLYILWRTKRGVWRFLTCTHTDRHIHKHTNVINV